MKLHQIPLILFILFLTFQISFEQEKPKAVKVDEIGQANCEMFDARMDNFLVTLQNTKATGYSVIFGDKNHALEKYRQENLIKSYAAHRGFANRLFIVHGNDKDVFKTEFWQVPTGAEKPTFEEQKWDYSLSNITKPFILYLEGMDDDICPALNANDLMAKLLLANPNINARFIIYSNSARKSQKTTNKLINVFIGKYKIPRNRLKIFYSRKKRYADLEYWIVPKKRG